MDISKGRGDLSEREGGSGKSLFLAEDLCLRAPRLSSEQGQLELYDLISDSPAKRIYEAVKKIPYGHVATYAQIAELAGDRKMARAVGNALHKNPDPDGIPCFRVVNSKGELAGEFAFGGSGAQAKLLMAEGIEVKDGRVDLARFQWRV